MQQELNHYMNKKGLLTLHFINKMFLPLNTHRSIMFYKKTMKLYVNNI